MPDDSDPGCCLRSLLNKVGGARADVRLPILKQAAMQYGGDWDLPADSPDVYDPVMPSISVLGVTAFAETVDELPFNWMRAARNALGEEASGRG